MMIILLTGVYKTLDFFAESMMNGYNGDEEILLLDVAKADEFVSEKRDLLGTDTVVITFNNVGLFSELNKNGVRFYDFLVDHPINYIREISSASVDTNFVLIDEGHKLFLENIFENRKGRFLFIPHGGYGLPEVKEYDERDIDIVFAGRMEVCTPEELEIDFLEDKGKEFYRICREILEEKPTLEADEIVLWFCKKTGFIPTDNGQWIVLVLAVTMSVMAEHINYQHRILMDTLVSGGFNIKMIGHSCKAYCDSCRKNGFNNVEWIDQITPMECLEYYNRAKFVVNVQPQYTRGAHERIFNSLLNGAIPITNRSRYLESRLADEMDALYVDYDEIDSLCDKVAGVLYDEEYWTNVSNHGRLQVESDTWGNRLMEILELGK